jgi:hypothetical protein
LYITADNSLKEVCVNGGSLPLGVNADIVSKMDRMTLPAGWNTGNTGYFTIRARNSNPRSWGGILACVKSPQLVNLYWQCVELPELSGASCCGSGSNAIWNLPSSSNILKMGPNQGKKKNFLSKLPPQCTATKDQTSWVWDNHRLQPNVCCRSAPCAPLCDSCDTAGPGKCDPGKCRFSATGAAAPTAVCTSKCFVKAEIFAGTGTAYYPKAQITNAATGDVYVLPIVNNQYAFMINVDTCRPVISGGTEFTYGTDSGVGTGQLVNSWVSFANAQWVGSYIVDLGSGGGMIWMGITQSNGDGTMTYTDIYGRGNKTASFTLSGYTLSLTTQAWSDVVTVPF